MLDKLQIKLEIEKNELQIKAYETEIWTENQEQELIGETISACNKYKRKKEEKIEETMSVISNKLKGIEACDKFKQDYKRNTTNALTGKEMQQAFAVINAVLNRLRNARNDSIERVDYLREKINWLERENELLRNELNQLKE